MTKRVLVMNGNELIRERMTVALKDGGYEVTTHEHFMSVLG